MREQKRADIQRNFIESTDIKFGRIHKTSDEYRHPFLYNNTF